MAAIVWGDEPSVAVSRYIRWGNWVVVDVGAGRARVRAKPRNN